MGVGKAPRTKEMSELGIFLSIWYTIKLELTEMRRVISTIPYRTIPVLLFSTFVILLMHTVVAELHLPLPTLGVEKKNMMTERVKKGDEGEKERVKGGRKARHMKSTPTSVYNLFFCPLPSCQDPPKYTLNFRTHPI